MNLVPAKMCDTIKLLNVLSQLRALNDSYEANSILPALRLVLQGQFNSVALGKILTFPCASTCD